MLHDSWTCSICCTTREPVPYVARLMKLFHVARLVNLFHMLHDSWTCSMLHDSWICSMLHNSWNCSICCTTHEPVPYVARLMNLFHMLHDSWTCSMLHDSWTCSMLHDSWTCSMLHDSWTCSMLHDYYHFHVAWSNTHLANCRMSNTWGLCVDHPALLFYTRLHERHFAIQWMQIYIAEESEDSVTRKGTGACL